MIEEEFLLPGEKIEFIADYVKYGGHDYKIFITNKRIILYRKKGFLIFKRNDIIFFKISDIVNVQYKEKGLLFKKGILIIDTRLKRISFESSPDVLKSIYQNIMKFWEVL